LLTDRLFYIYIDYPCKINFILKPNIIKWEIHKLNINIDSIDLNLIDNERFVKNLTTLDLLNYYEDKKQIILRNNLDWFQSLSINKKLFSKIKSLGYEPSNFTLPYLMHKWFTKKNKIKLYILTICFFLKVFRVFYVISRLNEKIQIIFNKS
jgi:hypothetical protein